MNSSSIVTTRVLGSPNRPYTTRLKKEKEMYEKEAVEIEEKIEKMKEDGKDEYDIKKMVSSKPA